MKERFSNVLSWFGIKVGMIGTDKIKDSSALMLAKADRTEPMVLTEDPQSIGVAGIEEAVSSDAEVMSYSHADSTGVCFLITTSLYRFSEDVYRQSGESVTQVARGEIAHICLSDLHLLDEVREVAVKVVIAGNEGFTSNLCLARASDSVARLEEAERIDMQTWSDNDSIIWDAWAEFRNNTEMVERCAHVIAEGVNIDEGTDCPACCFWFRDSDLVRNRVAALRENYEKTEQSTLTIASEVNGKQSIQTIDLSEALNESKKRWRHSPPIADSPVRLKDFPITKLTLPRDGCTMSAIVSHVAMILAGLGMSGYGATEASKQLKGVFIYQIEYILELIDLYKEGELTPAAAKRRILEEYDRLEKNNHYILKRILISLKDNLLDGVACVDEFYVAERFINPNYDSLFRAGWVERKAPKDISWIDELTLPSTSIIFEIPDDVVATLDKQVVSVLVE